MSEPIFDPFSSTIKEALSDKDQKAFCGRVIREMSALGSEAALYLLVTMMGYILWCEGVKPGTPAFEEAMAALHYALRNNLQSLQTASQIQNGNVH